ncbi:PIR protein [Plasmodium yoelii]|uniref:PIR protein n=2 Tax=Plasmodium yoelii TaxID=5861 RepID=A0AAE9WXB1_PLAYO|nr:PIR protein [Plasmodium yoelii]WBY58262.1 PIR protein [Plasmodium yoelii yoelii]CDS44870.1 YIR protein [Plasmodium yoelii]VTZ79182.1 PIR protein [Plasmodium yoelii]|eukprot:XP_022813441.1 PIR protein [Plasmodium yoelii]
MDDNLCSKFDFLRNYLPDKLGDTPKIELKKIKDYEKYCPDDNCNTEIDKVTIGFLWLLGQYYSIPHNKSYNENNMNAFFLYMISWFSYKLKQNTDHKSIQINDFYTKHVQNCDKYKRFIDDSTRFTDLDNVLVKKSDFLNINIEDMSNFYDAFKLICNMYGKVSKNEYDNTLSNNAIDFIIKYTELKNGSNIKDNLHNQILSALSTNYNNLKNKCDNAKPSNFSSLPEITTNISALTSEYTSSSSSIGNKLFTVLSIFGAIAFFLGISYKYSLFGFRKRAQKQYIREKIKNIKKRMNH